ncbi:hypothetical protein CGMCC3_g12821 [Colletotrichum fructicola]|nr:uncharacterized protein CGMCC3_g12821 [Colletotrichum fructicola]KAE9571172.1 hypothetical protein CGMCC3_g12821 [Colletotrichum fructicola]
MLAATAYGAQALAAGTSDHIPRAPSRRTWEEMSNRLEFE